MPDLSNEEARRIALFAQGFHRVRPKREPNLDDMRQVISDLGLIQIDTVNVLARAHYLPFFSRLGPYRDRMLDELTYEHRELFEYWGHAASFIPMVLYPAFRHRMEMRKGSRRAKWLKEIEDEFPGFIDAVLNETRERGPISVSDLSDSGGRTGPWWGLSRGKMALEWHFDLGNLAVSDRKNFTRYYDAPEKVIPTEHLEAPALSVEDSHRQMLMLSVKSHGIGTARDLADYYRVGILSARERLSELVSSGQLREVAVEGWDDIAYIAPDTDVPSERSSARALISPFDSLVWERDRTERMFGFRYRIEIYVPEPKRQFGYYVLPFLMDEELVARVDLKADRHKGRLLVQSAHIEEGRDKGAVSEALAAELTDMARWLGLSRVVVGRKGDLTKALRGAVKGFRT